MVTSSTIRVHRIADAGQCHLDPGGAGSSPKPGSVQPQGEDQPDGPVDDDVLPFAELAGGDLETEAAARPRLQIG